MARLPVVFVSEGLNDDGRGGDPRRLLGFWKNVFRQKSPGGWSLPHDHVWRRRQQQVTAIPPEYLQRATRHSGCGENRPVVVQPLKDLRRHGPLFCEECRDAGDIQAKQMRL